MKSGPEMQKEAHHAKILETHSEKAVKIPKSYYLRCGSGQLTIHNPLRRGSMARSFAGGLFPAFGGTMYHPFL